MTDKQQYLQRWLDKAEKDLRVAVHEFAIDKQDRVNEAVCFHCQQAVEKYLKAYLIYKEMDFGKTHNLEYLIKLCSEGDESFSQLEVGNLSFFAVEVRYPDDFYIPTEKETQESIKLAKNIKDFVLSRLK